MTTANPRPTATLIAERLFQLYPKLDGSYDYPNWWPDADEKREDESDETVS